MVQTILPTAIIQKQSLLVDEATSGTVLLIWVKTVLPLSQDYCTSSTISVALEKLPFR